MIASPGSETWIGLMQKYLISKIVMMCFVVLARFIPAQPFKSI
jgi:hypothetical protein